MIEDIGKAKYKIQIWALFWLKDAKIKGIDFRP